MDKIYRLPSFFCVALWLLFAPEVLACEGVSPQIIVQTFQEPVRYDSSLSIRQLQNLSGGAGPLPDRHMRLGAAQATTSISVTSKSRLQRRSISNYCLNLVQLTIKLGFSNNTIVMGRELIPGTCPYREVRAHEEHHVEIDRQLLPELAAVAKANFEEGFADFVVAGRDPEEMKREVEAELNQRIQATLTDLEQIRNEAQQSFDSPAEYGRISRACNGEVQSFVQKFLR